MTLAIDSEEASGTAHHSATSPLTWSFTNAAGNVLLVGVVVGVNAGGAGNPTVSGVTYNGVSLTQVGSITYSGTDIVVYLFKLASPATGTNTVSVSFAPNGGSTNGLDCLGAAISFSGASGGVGTTATAKNDVGGSTTASVAVNGTINGNYVVSVAATGTSFTGANSPTLLSAELNASGNTAGDNIILGKQSTSGGSVTASFSENLDFFGIVAAEVFAPSSAVPQYPSGSPIIRVQYPPWR